MELDLETLKVKLVSARDLLSIVKTMKSLSAVKVSRFEEAVTSLQDYHLITEKAMIAFLNSPLIDEIIKRPVKRNKSIAIITGTDLGMVGNYNDELAQFVLKNTNRKKTKYWAFGEKILDELKDNLIEVEKLYHTPDSLSSLTTEVTKLVNDLLKEPEIQYELEIEVNLFHFSYERGMTYGTTTTRLLPLDQSWFKEQASRSWSSRIQPTVIYSDETILSTLVKEVLFVKLFKSMAETIMAENTARLRYMQHAEKKIEESIDDLEYELRKTRQQKIDNELFEVIASYEALRKTT